MDINRLKELAGLPYEKVIIEEFYLDDYNKEHQILAEAFFSKKEEPVKHTITIVCKDKKVAAYVKDICKNFVKPPRKFNLGWLANLGWLILPAKVALGGAAGAAAVGLAPAGAILFSILGVLGTASTMALSHAAFDSSIMQNIKELLKKMPKVDLVANKDNKLLLMYLDEQEAEKSFNIFIKIFKDYIKSGDISISYKDVDTSKMDQNQSE